MPARGAYRAAGALPPDPRDISGQKTRGAPGC